MTRGPLCSPVCFSGAHWSEILVVICVQKKAFTPLFLLSLFLVYSFAFANAGETETPPLNPFPGDRTDVEWNGVFLIRTTNSQIICPCVYTRVHHMYACAWVC